MGEIVELYPRPKGKPWTYSELCNQRPPEHAGVKFGPRGKVLLVEDQVWVEIGSERLWVVAEMWVARKTFYKHNVLLLAYRGSQVRMLPETGLRANMFVWDEYAEFDRQRTEKFGRMAKHDPDPPWCGQAGVVIQAGSLFGFDARSSRIRD